MKKALDRTFLFQSLKKVTVFLIATLANFGLTFFYLTVLDAHLIIIGESFWLTLPVVFGLTYYFIRLFKQYFTNRHDFNFLDLLIFVILIFDVPLLLLNDYAWTKFVLFKLGTSKN